MRDFLKRRWRDIAIVLLLANLIGGTAIPALAEVIRVHPRLQDATDISVEELDEATYDDVQDYINFFGDRTLLSGGEITAHGDADGSVAIAACTAWAKESDSDTAVGVFFDYDGKAKQTLTDLSVNLIYLDYNGGTPQIVVATAPVTYGFNQDHILIGVVFRQGNAVHIFQSSNIGIQGINRAFMHQVEHHGAHRSSGLVTTDGGALSLAITAGVIYAGLNRQTTTIDGSTWSYWYTSDSGATWAEDTGISALVQSYNDITSGKVALGSNKYGVHWIYVDYEGSHLHIVYGQGNYAAPQAEAAGVPAVLPPMVTSYGVLIAKIINQEGTNTLTITYPWTTVFTSSLATDHGSLAGLADDDHPQYLKDIVGDATPQLGGDLDAEGHKIHDQVSPYAAKTSAYTTTVDDEIIAVGTTFGAVTITLGTAACRAGQTIVIKDSGGYSATHAITIDTEGEELIDSAATDTINRNSFSKQYYSNGTNWFSYSLTDDNDAYGLMEAGTFASLPDVGIKGRLYWATDTKELWRDTGFGWQRILQEVELENPPTEDEDSKAPTSEWAFDHDAATTGVHGLGDYGFTSVTTEAITLYVDAGSGNDNNAGTSGSPKATIQGALDALPVLIAHTCTICVRGPQDYSDSVIFDRFDTPAAIVLKAVNSSDEDMYDNGQADAGGGNDELVDATKSWSTDQFDGAYVWIYGGTGKGQIREVDSNDGTTLTTTANWTTNPDATSYYAIGGGATLTSGSIHVNIVGKRVEVYGFEHTGTPTYDVRMATHAYGKHQNNYHSSSATGVFAENLSYGFVYFNFFASTVKGVWIVTQTVVYVRSNVMDGAAEGVRAQRGAVIGMHSNSVHRNYILNCTKGIYITEGGAIPTASSQNFGAGGDANIVDIDPAVSATVPNWYT